jgi:diguanylate cyclase (GGDEF)-like protein
MHVPDSPGVPPIRVLLIDHDAARAAASQELLRARMRCTTDVHPTAPMRIDADIVVIDADACTPRTLTTCVERCQGAPVIVAADSPDDNTIAGWIAAGAEDAAPRATDALVSAVRRANARVLRDAPESSAGVPDIPVLTRSSGRLRSLVSFLHAAAYADTLTGLPNRRAFESKLLQCWAESSRSGGDLAVIMIDIDDFKGHNDRGGHAAGDAILVSLARILRAHCRRDDIAARLGGDELAVLLPGASADQARAIAERICGESGTISPEMAGAGHVYSLSMGVTSRAAAGVSNASELVANGDRALYAAKGAGKGRVRVLGEVDPVKLATAG